jgi:hypothetical protein
MFVSLLKGPLLVEFQYKLLLAEIRLDAVDLLQFLYNCFHASPPRVSQL